MQIVKLSTNEPTTRARLRNTVKMAKRNSKRFCSEYAEIKKNLPEKTDIRKNKYFGQPANQDGGNETTTADIIVGLGAIAAGLGLAFL